MSKFLANDNQKKPRQEYQHQVSVWNYDTGMVIRGCFRNGEAARNFMDTTDGHEKTLTADYGDWPYGTFAQSFDLAAMRRRQAENDYQSNGND